MVHALAGVARPLVLGGAWLGGYQGGLYRVLPSQPALLGERYSDSEAGPVRACRALEWVVTVARANGPVYAALQPPTPALWASGPASLLQAC